MTLRDEIRDALMTYENDIRSVASGAEYQDTTTAAADAILAKVREALLSDEAVEAGARSLHSEEHLFVGEWEVPHEARDPGVRERPTRKGGGAMSNLRDEIARAVARAVDRALDGERAMTPPPLGGWHPLVTDAVDDILAKIREALLSNDAQAPIRQELHDYPRTSPRGTVSTVIEMALDAVTGEGDER